MPETLRDWSVIFFLRVFSGRYCQKQSCDVLEERSHPLRNRLNPQNPLRRLPGVLAVLHGAAKTAIGGSYAQYRAGDLTTRTLLELLVAYTLILITVWTSGWTQRVLFYASGGWILLNSYFPDPLFGDLAKRR